MGKKIKVFCDSNIFFSAIYTDFKNSYPSLIVKLAENNFFDIYFSNLVELEVKYNIEKKIPQKIDVSNKLFRKFIRVEDVIIELEILNKLPEKDRIILSTAIYYRMDYFITGNVKDFSYLLNKKIGETLVLSPKEFCYKENEK